MAVKIFTQKDPKISKRKDRIQEPSKFPLRGGRENWTAVGSERTPQKLEGLAIAMKRQRGLTDRGMAIVKSRNLLGTDRFVYTLFIIKA